jgi:riboflavin-specific deaminase-like protein
MSMTADGKIATANRQVSSFSSRCDRAHLLDLRATADAVMAGARTVDLNAVSMSPGPLKYRRKRLEAGLAEYNLRVIVSRTASVNPGATIFKSESSPIIVLTTQQAPAARLNCLQMLAEVRVFGKKEIDFAAALGWLRTAHGVRTLLCEGGGELNDALFRAGLVDELHLTICPLVFGGRQAPTVCDGLGSPTLAGADTLELHSSRRIRDELFLVYRAKRTGASRTGSQSSPGRRH